MIIFNITPIVTEKSTLDSHRGAYHFKIPANIGKIQLKQTLKAMYGTEVASVNIVKLPLKKRMAGKKTVTRRKALKKAIVTFKGNATIDINAIKN